MIKDDAINIVREWGYCCLKKIQTPDLLETLSRELLEKARTELVSELEGWTLGLVGLSDEWYSCSSPVDADSLCEHWIERRTNVWAMEVAFKSVGFHVDVTEFDAALRQHESVLATVVGFPWYDNHVAPFRAVENITDLPWWLSDHLATVAAETDRRAEATLPPPEYLATVERLRKMQ